MSKTPDGFAAVPWGKKEDETIKRLYPSEGGVAIRKLLPGRSLQAVQMRAQRLKVYYLKRRPPGQRDARPRGEQPPLQVRRCLMCIDDFTSDGKHNRICRKCKLTDSYRGNAGVGW